MFGKAVTQKKNLFSSLKINKSEQIDEGWISETQIILKIEKNTQEL